MRKTLVALCLLGGLSFANAATHAEHVANANSGGKNNSSVNAKSSGKIGLELPIAPVGAFRGGLF